MIGKEYLKPLEELYRRLARVYPDACDVGLWETPEIRATIRRSLEGLRELEGGRAEAGHAWSSYTTYLAFSTREGVVVRVARHRARGGRHFYSISLEPGPRPAGLGKDPVKR